jgi:hypothetical protein
MTKEAEVIEQDEGPSAEELLLQARANDFEEPESNNEDDNEEVVDGPSAEEVEIQSEASKMGWVPKDKYDGDPKRWVDAGEFVRRQELFDKIHSQSKELTKMRKQMEAITKKVTDWSESQYLTELARLRAKRKAAMDAEDIQSADDTNEEIAKLQVAHDSIQEDVEDQADGNQDVQAHAKEVADKWVSNNTWFNEEPELREMADAFAAAFSNNPANQDKTVEDLFSFVDKKMKKHVTSWEKAQSNSDDDSEEEKPEKEVKMSKVASAPKASRGARKATPKYSRHDLDPTQLSVLVNFILPNKIMTEEQYIQDLVNSGDVAGK